jgi:hypothetical protein
MPVTPFFFFVGGKVSDAFVNATVVDGGTTAWLSGFMAGRDVANSGWIESALRTGNPGCRIPGEGACLGGELVLPGGPLACSIGNEICCCGAGVFCILSVLGLFWVK